MRIKGKKTKTVAQKTSAAKIDANFYYSCSNNGTRHPCRCHCKKCYFEILYCPNS